MRANGIAAAGLAAWAVAAAGQAAAQAPDPSQEPLTERHETFESAVGTPAEDLNLKQTPIPDVLQRAQISPYDMRTMDRCDAIGAEVERLDAALGADRDEPPVKDTRTPDEKRDSTAASALKLGIEAVTPYRGIVRWVTGADAHAKSLQETIEAGYERRGFLKGMAVRMNCPPPASPAWFAPTRPAAPAYTAAQAPVYQAPVYQAPAYDPPPRYVPYAAPAEPAEPDPYSVDRPRTYDSYQDQRDYRDDRPYRDGRYDPYDR